MDQQKPSLTILPKPITSEAVLEMYRALTSREPTPEEVAGIRARMAEKRHAKDQDKLS